MEQNSLKFERGYAETITLAAMPPLRIRMIQADDKSKMALAFRGLSTQSRYRRCFSLKKELTPQELDFLCEVDTVNHLALVAVSLDEHGREHQAIGGVRFIRLAEDAEVAEVAFLVVDAWQRKGIGRLLLERLVAAAAERGIRKLRCYLLAENNQARHFVQNVSMNICWDVSYHNEGALLAVEFTIAPETAVEPEEADLDVFMILELAAKGYSIVPATMVSVASKIWWQEVRRSLVLWNGIGHSDAA